MCFGVCATEAELKIHLLRYNCRAKNVQPSAVKLPKKGSVVKFRNLKDGEGADLTVIIDIESRLIDINKVINKNRDKTNEVDGEKGINCDEEKDQQFREFMKEKNNTDNISQVHIPQSVCMTFLYYKNNPIGIYKSIKDNIGDSFPDIIYNAIKENMGVVIAGLTKFPRLTTKDKTNFQRSDKCMFCEAEFARLSKQNKQRHHEHHIKGKWDSVKGEWEKGNYLGAACGKCNRAITNKRSKAICLFHNASGYDLPMLMEGLTANKEYIKELKILPKGPNSYYVKFKNASFIDSCSFISAPLGELVELRCRPIKDDPDKVHELLPITSKYISQFFGDEVLQLIYDKHVYPYNLAKNVADLKSIKKWPPKNQFYNILNETNNNKDDVLPGNFSDK